ncbi:hypothetical protein [Chryseobacterium sp. POE27]|uniref:hypothetical protein n=1 Tax=Chryseobacterium sp. POE27 TaxID=3138177 RepID=UPI00321B905D
MEKRLKRIMRNIFLPLKRMPVDLPHVEFLLIWITKKRKQIQSWSDLFLPYGIYDFKNTYSGTDLYPLHDMGIPTAELVPDSQRYFDIHHTEEDTFEKVNRRELLLGAVAMTQLIYMIDKNW